MRELVVFGSLVSAEIDEASRATRAGANLIRLFAALGALKPLLVLVAAVAVSAVALVEPALAQSVLNGDASKPVRAVQRAVEVAMWGTLAMGIFGLCWGGWNKTTGKAWGGQMIGGGICH